MSERRSCAQASARSPCRSAAELLNDGAQGVAIADDKDHRIFGADLVACCNGEKALTADLRAN
jgi:hypothetical protein